MSNKSFKFSNIFAFGRRFKQETETVSEPTVEEKTATINTDEHELFSWEGKTFVGKPCDVYDGDTLSVCWYYNGEIVKYRCRCNGYDSPEMRPSLSLPNRDEVKAKALEAKNRFKELLQQDSTITIKCDKFEKYGRTLITIFNKTNGNKSLNQIMIDEGYGYVYTGGTKRT